MIAYDRAPQLSLDSLPEHLSVRGRGARGGDVFATVLHQLSRTPDLRAGLMELYEQGGRPYAEAMSALQQVLGNARVEQLHQQLTELAQIERDARMQDVQRVHDPGRGPSNAELLDAGADGASASGDAVPFAEEMGALLGVDFRSSGAEAAS